MSWYVSKHMHYLFKVYQEGNDCGVSYILNVPLNAARMIFLKTKQHHLKNIYKLNNSGS